MALSLISEKAYQDTTLYNQLAINVQALTKPDPFSSFSLSFSLYTSLSFIHESMIKDDFSLEFNNSGLPKTEIQMQGQRECLFRHRYLKIMLDKGNIA
jgi:hypothetical protein